MSIADGGGLEDAERSVLGGKLRQQEVARRVLAGVDRPKEGGDPLRIASLGERGIVFDGIGNLGCCAGLDHFHEMLAHVS